MRAQCLQAVANVIGRQLTSAESLKIEQRIKENKLMIGRSDLPAYRAMTDAQRFQEAAKLAGKQISDEAKLKQQRAAAAISTYKEKEVYLNSQPGLKLENLDRTLAAKDLNDNYQSVATLGKEIYTEETRKLSDEIESFGPKLIGILDNNQAMIPVVMELHGKASNIPEAKAFADKLKASFEGLRQRFNAAGGKIGKLDDYGLPHAHNAYLVFKAGQDAWVKEIMPLLNANRYINEDGSLMDSAQMTDFLNNAWESIAYDGAKKDAPTPGATGMRANRESASRQIHFKDAESYMSYHSKFADKSFMATVVGHIHSMSNQIALLEKYGPNPDAQFAALLHEAKVEAVNNKMAPDTVNRLAKRTTDLYNEVAGIFPEVHNRKAANAMAAIRTYLNIKLGSAVITSFGDEATAAVTLNLNNISKAKYFAEELKLLSSSDARRHARRLGLGMETMLFGINRYGQDMLANGMSQKVSGAVIRGSGLGFMTELRRQAFGKVMMDAIGHVVENNATLASIHADDNHVLLSKGVTDADFAIWKLAKLDVDGSNRLLTSQSIFDIPDADLTAAGFTTKQRTKAASRLMGAILEETDQAIISPGPRATALTRPAAGAGSLQGEIFRSVLQFKSFPITMIEQHWRRMMSMPGGKIGSAKYAASLIAYTTVFGALALQLSQITNDKDPLKMNDPAFLGKALLKGGALGLYGDFLSSTKTQYGQSMIEAAAGPALGTISQVANVTLGNALRLANDEKIDTGAKLINTVKGLTPGTSVWYLKSAFNHMIFQQWQEMASPGYLSRMETRAKKEFGQKFFWKPGTKAPQRMPDLSRAIQK